MKRGKHPTTKRRKQSQRRVKRYMELREDLQVAGRIPVEPAGAIRDERVDPSVQGSQPLPGIALMAIDGDRKGTWKVPDEKKQPLVREMVDLVEAQGEDAPPAVVKVMAFNALAKADQLQYERDHPEEAGKAKGGTKVNVGVAVSGVPVTDIGDLIRKAREQREAGKVVDANERGRLGEVGSGVVEARREPIKGDGASHDGAVGVPALDGSDEAAGGEPA